MLTHNGLLTITGLLTPPPRSLYPPPQGFGRQATCQLVGDDGRNWLLADPSGRLVHAAGHRVAVQGWSDGHGVLVHDAILAPLPGPVTGQPTVSAHGQLTLTGRVEPVTAAEPSGSSQPRHRLTGQHGTIWLLAPTSDLDGLGGNLIQAEGWLLQPQQILVAQAVRILPQARSA